MCEKVSIESGSFCLTFDPSNGAIAGLTHGSIELLLPASELFSVQMLDQEGNPRKIKSTEFKSLGFDPERFHYSGHPDFPELEVDIALRSKDGFFYFRPEIHNVPQNYILEWIDAPQIIVPGRGNLFSPFSEGVIITDPEIREASPWMKYHPLEFAKRGQGQGGLYPGVCQMQFLAFYNENGGVYFGAHDSRHGTKGVEYVCNGDGRTRLSLQTFCSGGQDYVSEFEYVLGVFDGDWMDACEIYRNWLTPPAMPKMPQWLDESPVLLIYAVRGDGDDCGNMGPNEYFPYINAMPVVRKYAEAFNSKIMPLLMHWEGTAPWAPPYVWPPFGGERLLAEFRDQLHEEGHLLGLYCSGSAWTQTSSITDYSCEEKCKNEGLEKYMMRGPKGEIEASICNGENSQRLGYDMCLSEEWPRRTVKAEIMKIARFGADYVQFFDQNLGGAFHLCYSREHHHPESPGEWQVKAMKSLLAESCSEIAGSGSRMIMGCESAAAEPYVEYLPFNDARPVFALGYGMPVPAYSFVHHERVNNFMGNQCGIVYHMNLLESPENLLYRTAYAFNAGDLLSLVLKDNGKIHWGWVLKWDYPEPDQESIITLIRNLNKIRKSYPEFLRYGKMIKPLNKIAGGKYCLRMTQSTMIIDSFLHSSWESKDGARIQIITNFLPRKQTVKCGEKTIEIDALNTVEIQ